MLEKVDLTVKLPKETYKRLMPRLQRRLYDLEKACWDAKIPSIIVFEGWDAAGKGTSINKLTSRLDPRGFKLYPIREARTFEKHLPWLWRFWQKTPNYGEMAIFDRSWYGRVLVERVEGLTAVQEWRKGYRDIVDFERTLADDGYVIVKFWLHISKKEQKCRFRKLEKDPLTSWHVQPEDWEHYRRYNEYRLAVEEMLERTDTEWGPWTIVEATDRRWARVKIFQTIIRHLEEALKERGFELPEEEPEPEEEEDEEEEDLDWGEEEPAEEFEAEAEVEPEQDEEIPSETESAEEKEPPLESTGESEPESADEPDAEEEEEKKKVPEAEAGIQEAPEDEK
jgi:polyphosphate kinase 2 (PPK2 family)